MRRVGDDKRIQPLITTKLHPRNDRNYCDSVCYKRFKFSQTDSFSRICKLVLNRYARIFQYFKTFAQSTLLVLYIPMHNQPHTPLTKFNSDKN